MCVRAFEQLVLTLNQNRRTLLNFQKRFSCLERRGGGGIHMVLPQGGNLKKLGQGARLTFLGMKFGKNLLFWVQRNGFIFWVRFFNIIFWGSDKVIPLIFLG